MAYDYEALYRETPDALGPPTARVLALIEKHIPLGAHILDVGCGQGRDAVPLARQGFRVTGIDIAPSGVAALNEIAAREALPLCAMEADIADWRPEETYDLILCDRTLHMLAELARHRVFARLIGATAEAGHLLVVDEAPNIAGLRAELDRCDRSYMIKHEIKGDLLVRLEP
ncbi:class I SAM-dependent methyltransferase [Pelagovum sp. HNIBRBA483]|uniref:class I SAM-dependent methyltransferase n=1 Tax=Pelagovum sp. HNIBRBA483 TaxID=3233341 RepID=UPI0034A1A5E3